MTKFSCRIGGLDEGCYRIYIILFNIMLSITGMAMILSGTWMLISLNKYGISNSDCFNLPWLTIIFGISIFASGCTSFLFFRKSFLLFMYASCLFVLFLFGVFLGVTLTFYNSRFRESLIKSITLQMENYLHNIKDTKMDRLQIELECCGNLEPNDWLKTSTGQIPPSCCKSKLCDPTKPEEIYDTGCYPKIVERVKLYTTLLGFTAVIGSILPLLGSLLLFTYAYHTVKEKYQPVE